MPAGNPNIGKVNRTPRQGVNTSLPNAFYNDTDPAILLKRESYRHRTMIALAEEGHTATEIAKIMDCTIHTVSQVLRQPWAREQMQVGIKTTLEQELRAMRDRVVKQSLENVIAIANDDTTKIKTETKLAANIKLLDRFLGTPVQHVEATVSGDPSQISDEQLARLAQEAIEPQPN